MSEPIFYKVLGVDGVCCHGGLGRWNTEGGWMPPVYGGLAPCVRGYHLSLGSDLVDWLGPVIWTAEGRGKSYCSGPYQVFQEARVIRPLEVWTPAMARGFAVECAERVLPILEVVRPGEQRVVVTLVRARGLVSDESGYPAARATAEGAWNVSRLVEGAARDAAIAVYGAAVWQSGGMAAQQAAGAARSAAAAAAWERSMSASKEKGLHPRDAERAADGMAAEAMKAERLWQTERLFALLAPALSD